MAIKLNYEMLIKEVKKRSPLWDEGHRNHNNIVIVDQLWGEISEKLNASVEIVKKKWKNLRDQFKTHYKKIEKNERENIKLVSNWYYFNSLLFLINQMESNTIKKRKNNEDAFPNLNDDLLQKSLNDDILQKNIKDYTLQNNVYVDYQDTEQNQFKQSTKVIAKLDNKKHKMNSLDKDTRLLEIKPDEDEAFFQSLVPHIEKMEPERKLLCRIEIQKAVYNFAYKSKHKF